jgi:hypothetical protein
VTMLSKTDRHDQAVRLLDIPKLQVVKIHKPTTSSFNHFNQVLAELKCLTS